MKRERKVIKQRENEEQKAKVREQISMEVKQKKNGWNERQKNI